MSMFDNIAKLVAEGEKLAAEHPDQVNAALKQAENIADEKTGHKFTAQIQEGAAKAAGYLDHDAPAAAQTSAQTPAQTPTQAPAQSPAAPPATAP